jgi:hypothetical protein
MYSVLYTLFSQFLKVGLFLMLPTLPFFTFAHNSNYSISFIVVNLGGKYSATIHKQVCGVRKSYMNFFTNELVAML